MGGGRGGRVGGLEEEARARAEFMRVDIRGEVSLSGGIVGRNGRVVREGEMGVLETMDQAGEEGVVEFSVSVEGVDAMITGVEGWLLFSEEGLQSVQVGEVHGEKRSGSRGEVSVVLGAVGWGEAIFARSRGGVHCFPM